MQRLRGHLERILKDGAIPAKYKLLIAMVTDAIVAHPAGVMTLADDAWAAGASEAKITEVVEVAYLYGGTAALVMSVNAFARRLPSTDAKSPVKACPASLGARASEDVEHLLIGG
jgi:alkylhydroperoxidase/carboxymuconolactone decarboxylase family protein YurZ